MGLGLFGTPIYLNLKCLAFSVILVGVYWLPKPTLFAHKIVFSYVLAMFAYVLLAWYDYFYDCTDQYHVTPFSWFSRIFKPKYYGDEYEALPVKYKKVIRAVDILFLVGLAGLTFSPYLGLKL